MAADTVEELATVVEAFVSMIKPQQREGRRTVEDDEFGQMLLRMIRALETRVIERPENLGLVKLLQARLAEVVNVAIATNAARYAIDPRSGASMMECARALDIKKQSASDRRKLGNQIIADRLEAGGGVRFAEAKRERAAMEAATAAVVTSFEDYRARHRAA